MNKIPDEDNCIKCGQIGKTLMEYSATRVKHSDGTIRIIDEAIIRTCYRCGYKWSVPVLLKTPIIDALKDTL